MLKRVHISKFRSCDDVTLDIASPMTVLVGRNGAGKTNVLAAIEWLGQAATVNDIASAKLPITFHFVPRRAVEVDLVIDGQWYRYGLSQRTQYGEDNKPLQVLGERLTSISVEAKREKETEIFQRKEESLQIKGREAFKIGRNVPSLSALSALLPERDKLTETVTQISSFLAGIRYYPLVEPNDVAERQLPIVQHSDFKRWEANPEVGDAASVTMRLIQMYLRDRARFDELGALLGPKGLKVLDQMVVSTLDVPRTGDQRRKFYVVDLTPAGAKTADRGSFAYHELSAGTRRLLRLLVCLLFDSSSVMLLEQPEDGLHPGLAAKLLGILQAYGVDRCMVLSTHSPAMLDAIDPQALRIVELRSGVTHLRSMSTRELRAAKGFLEDDGSLYEFLESVGEA